jgi:hypothetical protein
MSINKIALLRLADKLEGKGPYIKDGPIKKSRFRMDTWIETSNVQMQFNKNLGKDVVLPNLTCGTSACAAGWAGSDPWFRKRGFFTGPDFGVCYVKYNEATDKHDKHYDFLGVMMFFDIPNYEDAKYLFFPYSSYEQTPNAVAMRIREYVRKMKDIMNYSA